MSSSYSNLTVVATSSDASGLGHFEDATNLFDPLSSAVLICNSSNWLLATLDKMTTAYETSNLEYLGAASAEFHVLDASRVRVAIQAIEQLLDQVLSDPGIFVRLAEQACSEAEVLTALGSPPRLPEPDHSPDNDWGYEEPLTAIGFLRSHLEVLRIARDSGRCAIHARS